MGLIHRVRWFDDTALYCKKVGMHMICGVDEAGRGPVLGPMVIAAVKIENDGPLRQLKVKDSKLLTRVKREQLAVEIRKIAEVEVVIISADAIDKYREVGSLNLLEVEHFATLIDRLVPEQVFVDAVDVVQERFGQMICDRLKCRPDMVSEHRADIKYPVVSAASIIAKTVRDVTIDDIEKELGEPIGSGYAHDVITRAFLEKWIREKGDFPPHTRRSWRTAKEIYSLSKVTRLTEWTEKNER
jgi:ribonuclease HII